MRSRTKDRLQELDELYPPQAPWRLLPDSEHLTAEAKAHEQAEWQRVRKAMKDFLEIDGRRRMQRFENYQIGPRLAKRLDKFGQCLEDHGGRSMKSTSMIPTPVEYTLPLYLDDQRSSGAEEQGEGNKMVLALDNPTGVKERKVLSYIRYLLRSAGIGYHCLTNDAGGECEGNYVVYQLVLALPHAPSRLASIPRQNPTTPDPSPSQGKSGWVASLNPFKRPQVARSISMPAQKRPPAQARATTPDPAVTNPEGTRGKTERWLRIWIKIEFEHSSPTSSTDGHSQATSASASASASAHFLSPLITSGHLPELSFNTIYHHRRPSPSPRRKTTSDRFAAGRPSPLSRNGSVDAHAQGQRGSTPARGRDRGRVIIRLSDERGYEVLRQALDIKHVEEDGDGSISPVIIHAQRHEQEEEQGEERGRPRSKESGHAETSALLLSKGTAKHAGHVGVQVVRDDDEEAEEGRGGARKKGFLSLFTAGESERERTGTGTRSVSVPPPQEPVVH